MIVDNVTVCHTENFHYFFVCFLKKFHPSCKNGEEEWQNEYGRGWQRQKGTSLIRWRTNDGLKTIILSSSSERKWYCTHNHVILWPGVKYIFETHRWVNTMDSETDCDNWWGFSQPSWRWKSKDHSLQSSLGRIRQEGRHLGVHHTSTGMCYHGKIVQGITCERSWETVWWPPVWDWKKNWLSDLVWFVWFVSKRFVNEIIMIINHLKKFDYQRVWWSNPSLCLIIKCFDHQDDHQDQEPNNQTNQYPTKNLICDLVQILLRTGLTKSYLVILLFRT